jgi:ribonuclease G
MREPVAMSEPREPRNTLVLHCTPHEVRAALLEGGKVAEIYVERRKDSSLVGNIYKGRVIRVLPGMQAAFVDIGLERAAFLYVADVAGGAPTSTRDHSGTSTVDGAARGSGGRSIQQLLHEGQEIMVQVAKGPIGTKGARVTSHVSIAGRHLVYMPTVEHIGVSRRIADEEERRRLREILEALVPDGGGFVARTAAEGRSPDDLRADLEFLRQIWNDILVRLESLPAPTTLHEDLDLVRRSARDLVTPELDEILVDDADEYGRLVEFMRRFMPRYVDRVRHYDRTAPVFEAYGVEIELQRALGRKVWLKSGGYLIRGDDPQNQPRGGRRDRLSAPAPQHRRDHHPRSHRHGAGVPPRPGLHGARRRAEARPGEDQHPQDQRSRPRGDDAEARPPLPLADAQRAVLLLRRVGFPEEPDNHRL